MNTRGVIIVRSLVLVLALAWLGWGGAGCGLLAVLMAEPVASQGPVTRIERTRLCMGVPARITVDYGWYNDQSEVQAEAAVARAFDLLAELDGALSDYRIDSELNRVNNAAGGAAVAIGEPLASALATGTEVARASDGAFDVTVGPASMAWRATRTSGVLPPDDELARIRSLVDWRRLELDPAARTARLGAAGMRLDLGGIGKGFAAQRAVEKLRAEGFPRAMVALAGDIAVGDGARGAQGWRIEVSPTDERGLGVTVDLANQAISTSGDTEQFVEIGGRRYSHIVDPRTGLGTPGGVMVSVISPRGEWADALSTAAVVMLARGESESAVAEMLAKFPGSRALIERRSADGRPVRSEIGAVD